MPTLGNENSSNVNCSPAPLHRFRQSSQVQFPSHQAKSKLVNNRQRLIGLFPPSPSEEANGLLRIPLSCGEKSRATCNRPGLGQQREISWKFLRWKRGPERDRRRTSSTHGDRKFFHCAFRHGREIEHKKIRWFWEELMCSWPQASFPAL